MSVYTAAVIGLGQIGMGYDYDDLSGELALTHASAFNQHSGFELVGGVDVNEVTRKQFEVKFGKPSYSDIASLCSALNPDVIAIAVPTDLHAELFNESLSFQPKAIICEKPIASEYHVAENMINTACRQNVSVLVNYILRFEPSLQKLKKLIKSGEIGNIYKGTVWYAKGLAHNGSHFIDLIRFLLGEVERIQIINDGRLFGNMDPEPDFLITFGTTDIVFLAAREENFSMAQMELVGSNGVINYATTGESGIATLIQDPTFPGYTILGASEAIQDELSRVQYHVVDELHTHLNKGTELPSNGKTALETLKIVQTIIDERNEALQQ